MTVLVPAGARLAGASSSGPQGAIVRHLTIGRSVQGRPIDAVETGDPGAPLKVVVVGCIHGNETAGIAVARVLASRRPPAGVDLWIVPDMNPDGVAADTRDNANGVDLNRNFPWSWRPAPREMGEYPGRHPLSAPESRAVYALLLRLEPRLVVWYHQPLGVVDESGGSAVLEQAYSLLVGLPLKRLPRYHGSATSWADHRFPGSTSFVVELPPGPLGAAAARRHADAVATLAAVLA
jgi:protein MpaA